MSQTHKNNNSECGNDSIGGGKNNYNNVSYTNTNDESNSCAVATTSNRITCSNDSTSNENDDSKNNNDKLIEFSVAFAPEDYNTCSNNTINVKTASINLGLYPADTYSILALYGPIGNPAYFSFGLMVYLFQITFLLLMVLSVVHPKWSNNGDVDNPDVGIEGITQQLAQFIPANVDPLVRATQIMATLSYIIFADSTIRDIVLGIELFPSLKLITPDDKVGCMVFSSISRLSQGVLATIITLFLIVTTSNVIDIILNFTAINFISTLDNVGFEVIQWGKYGTKFKEEADRIEKLSLPTCIQKKNKNRLYWSTIIPIGLLLIACLCSIIILQENSDVWVTKTFRVKFQDTDQGLQHYSGCYMKTDNPSNSTKSKRKLYNRMGNNSESAKIGYCMEERRWFFFKGDTNITCEASGNDYEIAHSSKTDFFDISTSFDEIWYSASNTPLDIYFIESDKVGSEKVCEQLDDGICDMDLNNIDYDYDGGDCCMSTCTNQEHCGIGGLDGAPTFGVSNSPGDGFRHFPNCLDPDMLPITIRLDNILSSFEPQFQYDDDFIPDGFNKSSTINDIPRNSVDDDSFFIQRLLSIDCDGSNGLNIYVDKSMENQTETIMVSDGADCTMTIRNDGSDSDSIWYADYTIFHGDKKSIESNSIVVAQSSSAKESTYNFKRIPECYFDKLSDYIDRSIVYTGIDFDPTAKSVNWLMYDESETSMCEDPFLLERFYFAAPSNFPDYALISTTRQCVWPSIICDEGTVISLNINNENLIGTIPSEIGLLNSLKIFDLEYNELTGSIPSEIGLMTSLKSLRLYTNELTGSIPSEIGLMTSLVYLDLGSNAFTGSIPSEIGLMTSLKTLLLFNNRLTGSIPSEIGLMTSLTYVNLHYNALTGSIPIEIGLMTSLKYFDYNALTGSIPIEIGLMTSLKYFDSNL